MWRTIYSLVVVCISFQWLTADNAEPLINKNICDDETYDFIIVGNGTAGAALARFLSNKTDGIYKNKVLVLEAGLNYSNDPVILDASFPAVLNVTLDPKYSVPQLVDANTPPLGGLRGLTDFDQGRTWAGSSAHYHLFAVRGSADIYNEWAAISDNERWLFKNLLPIMKFMEEYIPDDTIPNLAKRGLTGLLPITQDPPVTNNVFAQAMSQATGAPLVADYNIVDIGVSARQAWLENIDGKPIRTFSSRSFLPSSVVTPHGVGVGGRKLTIFSKATAQKIIFDEKTKKPKAIGVAFIHHNKSKKAYARKKVILCCGGLTPSFLQRSGIGSSDLLCSLNIPVIVDSPNVGNNFINHYGVVGALQVDPSIPLPPMIMGFVDGKPYVPGPAGARRFEIIIGYPVTLNSKIVSAAGLTGERLVTISCQNLRPRSRGIVRAPDNDPLNLTHFNYQYYSDGGLNDPDSDASLAVAAFRVIHDIAATAHMLSGGKITLAYPLNIQSDALFRAAQDSPIATHHYSGTCAMGTDISNGVVDGDLQVFGVKHLMIADMSIAPILPTGNTAYSAYTIGLVAAQILGANLS